MRKKTVVLSICILSFGFILSGMDSTVVSASQISKDTFSQLQIGVTILKLLSCPGVNDIDWKKFPNLEELYLGPIASQNTKIWTSQSGGTQISAEKLNTVGMYCKNLVVLDLSERDEIKKMDWKKVDFKNFSKLKKLNLSANMIEDDELVKIAFWCKHLKELNLETCYNISKKAIEKIKILLPKCNIITDQFTSTYKK